MCIKWLQVTCVLNKFCKPASDRQGSDCRPGGGKENIEILDSYFTELLN
eukprot:g67896.t1